MLGGYYPASQAAMLVTLAVFKQPYTRLSGRSSGVEHNLAKVRVVSSNLIARSIFLLDYQGVTRASLLGGFFVLGAIFPENGLSRSKLPFVD
tara:strand:- start:648 stop:923 length:276 start_codon:yes stop_codon:yes gene_type:complete